MSKKKFVSSRRIQLALLACALAVLAIPDLTLGQTPPQFSQQPALMDLTQNIGPNIILTIDDSGSMSIKCDAVCTAGGTNCGNATAQGKKCDPGYQPRIDALKDALKATFGSGMANPYLNKFRFAFQAYWNNRGFGPNRFFKNSTDPDNSMHWFNTTEQENFLRWVDTLTGTGDRSNGHYSTPSQLAVIYAGEYLKGRWLSGNNSPNNATRLNFIDIPKANNPWNDSWDGDADGINTNNLPCRRSYLILMSDGIWNLDVKNNTDTTGLWENDNKRNIAMPYVSDVSGGSYLTEANYDGNTHTLPGAGTPSYNPTQWPIYSDAYPLQSKLSNPSAYNYPNNYWSPSYPIYDFDWYNSMSPCRGITYWQAIDSFSFNCSYSAASIYSNLKPISNLCDVAFLYNMGAPAGWGYSANSWINAGVKTLPEVTACSSTLSDFAMYYWSKNLTGDTSYSVAPQQSITTDQIVDYGGKSVTYPPFWNPQNDPATWQHMQTYTIGFGKQDQQDGGAGEITGTATLPRFDSFYGDFFKQFASGAVAWPATASSSVIPDANGIITSDSFTPGNIYDLVHAAYNGRGKYYSATSATALKDAFDDILKTALRQSSPGGTASASASGSRLTSGTVAYVASYAYDSKKNEKAYTSTTYWGTASAGGITGTIGGWSGSITANAGNDLYAHPLWAATIPAAATRTIYTTDASGNQISFEWNQQDSSKNAWATANGLTAADVNAVRNNPLGDIVNSQLFYVGKPRRLSLEPTYRNFANSDKVKNRKSMVYVGANDGMLHGFDAGQGTPTTPGSGVERVAYVPRGLLGKLHTNTFADATYAHRYWVDGSPFGGDVQLEASPSSAPVTSPASGASSATGANPETSASSDLGNWATVLVGTLGAGGPGYFVLDVTDPDNIQVLIDKTVPGEDPYIGNQFGQPVMEMYTNNQPAQITRINTQDAKGEWAVIMGNGYNSANGVPVLLVQSLSHTGKPLYKVQATCTSTASACVSAGNGLSAPRPIDVDGNGTADIVYAGDLMGNLWKFDISNLDHDQWKVAHTSGSQPVPMFKAVGPGGAAQPITSAPAVAPHPRGGFMVVFGTGKNLIDTDAADTRLNSVYGLYDNTSMTVSAAAQQVLLGSSTKDTTQPSSSPIPSTCLKEGKDAESDRYNGCLYQQTGGELQAANAKGVRVGTTSSAQQSQTIDNQSHFGWYYDIPEVANGNAGKVLANPVVMSGNTLMFYSRNVATSSMVGTAGPCNPPIFKSPLTTVNFFNLFTGHHPDSTITVLGTAYTSGNGNRFQIDGTTDFFLDGTDALQSVNLISESGGNTGSSGGSGNTPGGNGNTPGGGASASGGNGDSPDGNRTFEHPFPTQVGRRAGWRIVR